jgi:hypothetical protein
LAIPEEDEAMFDSSEESLFDAIPEEPNKTFTG